MINATNQNVKPSVVASTPLDAALRYHETGFSVMPIKPAYTDERGRSHAKEPALAWTRLQTSRLAADELEMHFRSGDSGVGIICGAVSGNYEVIDFDDEETAERYFQRLKQDGEAFYQGLLIIKTPRGYHIAYRCTTPVGGNKKLAQRKCENGIKGLIETRGEGGYVLAPGTPAAVHPSGKTYDVVQGDPTVPPKLKPEGRSYLLELACSFNEYVSTGEVKQAERELTDGSSKRVGDDFNERGNWPEILEPHGWTVDTRRADGAIEWTRPGKDGGCSATTDFCKGEKGDYFFPFSSNSHPFSAQTPYSKFHAYAVLNHSGDFKAAAKDLAAKGYGSNRMPYASELNDSPIKWEQPVLFDGAVDTPEIPCDILPPPFNEYAQGIVDNAQVPSALPVMLTLAVLATCLQKKVEVFPLDEWREQLSLWVLVALPPGSNKSAVVNSLTNVISAYEDEQAQRMEPEISKSEIEADFTGKRVEELKRRAGKEDNPNEREKLIAEAHELSRSAPRPVRAPRYWTSDATPEQVQNLLMQNNERTAVISDEAGIFEVMAGLYNDGKANLDVFLQSYTGSPVRVDRGNRTIRLARPAISFGLTAQPSVVEELNAGDKRKFRGKGTLGRFLFCMPKSNIGQRTIDDRPAIPHTVRARYEARILELLNMPEPTVPIRLTLAPQAKAAFKRFWSYIEKEQGEDGKLFAIQDWTSKLPGNAVRIAGLLHVAEFGTTTTLIAEATMLKALDLCDLLITHAVAAFDTMGTDPALKDAKELFKWISEKRLTEFRKSEAYRNRFRKSNAARLNKALEVLCDRNILAGFTGDTRKPSTFFRVNPKVYEQ